MPPIRFALAQTSPVSAPSGPPALEKPHSTSPFPTIDVNLAQAKEWVIRAKEGKADVVVFPEYFLQGIVNEGRQYLTFASQHLTAALQDLAREHDIAISGTIVHGSLPASSQQSPFPTTSPFSLTPSTRITPAQLEWAKYLEAHPPAAEDNEPVLHNTAFFIEGGSGKLIGEYIKRNLWHPEREYLTAGEADHAVFDTKWGKMGMMICWDMSHPAAAQTLVDQGAEIILAPTYWTATDSEPMIHNHDHPDDYELQVIQALCYARSFESETVWVMVNAGGPAVEGFASGSGVWAPLRGKIGGLNGEEGLMFVDVNTDLLKLSVARCPGSEGQADCQDARKLYKIREDANLRNAS